MAAQMGSSEKIIIHTFWGIKPGITVECVCRHAMRGSAPQRAGVAYGVVGQRARRDLMRALQAARCAERPAVAAALVLDGRDGALLHPVDARRERLARRRAVLPEVAGRIGPRSGGRRRGRRVALQELRLRQVRKRADAEHAVPAVGVALLDQRQVGAEGGEARILLRCAGIRARVLPLEPRERGAVASGRRCGVNAAEQGGDESGRVACGRHTAAAAAERRVY